MLALRARSGLAPAPPGGGPCGRCAWMLAPVPRRLIALSGKLRGNWKGTLLGSAPRDTPARLAPPPQAGPSRPGARSPALRSVALRPRGGTARLPPPRSVPCAGPAWARSRLRARLGCWRAPPEKQNHDRGSSLAVCDRKIWLAAFSLHGVARRQGRFAWPHRPLGYGLAL